MKDKMYQMICRETYKRELRAKLFRPSLPRYGYFWICADGSFVHMVPSEYCESCVHAGDLLYQRMDLSDELCDDPTKAGHLIADLTLATSTGMLFEPVDDEGFYDLERTFDDDDIIELGPSAHIADLDGDLSRFGVLYKVFDAFILLEGLDEKDYRRMVKLMRAG